MSNKLPLDSFSCQNPTCPHFQQTAQGNIKFRKYYGAEQRRLLKCRTCGSEFSEFKGTPLWNSKIPHRKVVDIVKHVTRGNCFLETAELVGCHRTTVTRVVQVSGEHAQYFHDAQARNLQVTSLQADERHNFVESKDNPQWDATVIDPKTKFLVQGEIGPRNAELAERVLQGASLRVQRPQGVVLFTDGWLPYQTLFPQYFGRAYQPKRQGTHGRHPRVAYRIPRGAAHVRIIKEYAGKRVIAVHTEIAAGSRRRVNEELASLGYEKPNTSAVERQNGTARRMNPHLVRKSLAFARLQRHRVNVAQVVQGVYNWCRPQRGLRVKLEQPRGRRLYQPRTPAMAIGLTDAVWSVERFLRTPRQKPHCRE